MGPLVADKSGRHTPQAASLIIPSPRLGGCTVMRSTTTGFPISRQITARADFTIQYSPTVWRPRSVAHHVRQRPWKCGSSGHGNVSAMRQGLAELLAPQHRARGVDDGVGQHLVVVFDLVGATEARRLARCKAFPNRVAVAVHD